MTAFTPNLVKSEDNLAGAVMVTLVQSRLNYTNSF